MEWPPPPYSSQDGDVVQRGRQVILQQQKDAVNMDPVLRPHMESSLQWQLKRLEAWEAALHSDLEQLDLVCRQSTEWAYPAIVPAQRLERHGNAEYRQSPPTSAAWDRAIKRIHHSILATGKTLDAFMRTFSSSSGCAAIDRYRSRLLNTILRSIAIILYDKEYQYGCSNNVANPLQTQDALQDTSLSCGFQELVCFPAAKPLFQHMLLVDYGFEAQPLRGSGIYPAWVVSRVMWPAFREITKRFCSIADQCWSGPMPSQDVVEDMSRALHVFECGIDLADFALMIHYYHTHHEELSREDYTKGLTGYTGIMNELIGDLSKGGPGPSRLIRKLSVDYHDLIPRCVQGSGLQEELRNAVKALAARYSIDIDPGGNVSTEAEGRGVEEEKKVDDCS